MFKVLITAIFFTLLLSTPVLAQDDAISSTSVSSKETLQERKEISQEKIDLRRTNIASKEAALKQRLNKFKDKTKAQATERVSNSLNKINSNRTNHFLKLLEKMTSILDRLEKKVTQAGSNGQDITSANQAITDARSSIETAKTAVEGQTTKDYTLVASSEAKIKDEAKSSRDSLRNDLASTRTLVIEAKQAVSKAIRTAATTLGGNNGQ